MSDTMELKQVLSEKAKEIDGYLEGYLDRGEYEKLVRAVKHYPQAGGKRLRPIMAMMVAEAVGREGQRTVPFACALEIVHNFTLIHDDVMDDDPVRRGQPAVHMLYDIPTAIIAGDAMFARGFEVLAETEVDPERLRRLLKLVSKTVWLIAEGQQMDIDFESREEVTPDEYLTMIEKKTAVLFACAAQGGAIVAQGSEEQIEDMYEYARLLGISFQIWDDVLGIMGDEETLGKPVGSDIRNGKRTLIALHALENSEGEARTKLESTMGDESASEQEISEAIEVLRETGSIDFARDQAMEYADRAKSLLECLGESGSRKFLEDVVDFAVGREV